MCKLYCVYYVLLTLLFSLGTLKISVCTFVYPLQIKFHKVL